MRSASSRSSRSSSVSSLGWANGDTFTTLAYITSWHASKPSHFGGPFSSSTMECVATTQSPLSRPVPVSTCTRQHTIINKIIASSPASHDNRSALLLQAHGTHVAGPGRDGFAVFLACPASVGLGANMCECTITPWLQLKAQCVQCEHMQRANFDGDVSRPTVSNTILLGETTLATPVADALAMDRCTL